MEREMEKKPKRTEEYDGENQKNNIRQMGEKNMKEKNGRLQLYVSKKEVKKGTELFQRLTEDGVSVKMIVDESEKLGALLIQDVKNADQADWFAKLIDTNRVFLWEEKESKEAFMTSEGLISRIKEKLLAEDHLMVMH